MVRSEVADEELRSHLAAVLLTAELIANDPSLPDELRAMAETQHRRTQQLACALAARAADGGCDCYQWAARVCSEDRPTKSSGRRS